MAQLKVCLLVSRSGLKMGVSCFTTQIKGVCFYLKSLVFLVFFFVVVVVFLFFFFETGFLYSPGCLGTYFVDQAGLEHRNPPASASRVLGLKACATTAWPG